jgi:hypothetical protein
MPSDEYQAGQHWKKKEKIYLLAHTWKENQQKCHRLCVVLKSQAYSRLHSVSFVWCMAKQLYQKLGKGKKRKKKGKQME